MSFIEVCAGCGGLSSGLIRSGWKPVVLIENDKNAAQTLSKNHPNDKVLCQDMRTFDGKEYRNKVDLLCGGVPCQAFSESGKKRGLDDPRGNLILDFVRLLNDINPKLFLIENVKGLTTHNKGETLRFVLDKLQLDGRYNVQWKILNAFHYGVAQKRERIFIVGQRNDIKMPKFTYPNPISESERKVLRDALRDCPLSVGMKYSDARKSILELVPQGGCWVDLPQDIQQQYMGATIHSGGGKRGVAKRLHLDQPCLTLTTSPSQKMTERCHPTETRPLTIREYARIQTFSDNYEFCGSVIQQYKQIGNAVPVLLATHVGASLLESLG